MVGGAPVNEAFAEQIGADFYTPDAATAGRGCKAGCACKINRAREAAAIDMLPASFFNNLDGKVFYYGK